jgi:hypothetical protein
MPIRIHNPGGPQSCMHRANHAAGKQASILTYRPRLLLERNIWRLPGIFQ